MKKTLLLGAAGCFAAVAFAQEANTPLILPEFYSQKISPNGNFIGGSDGGDFFIIYDRAADKYSVFDQIYNGNGNAFADNGVMVGSTFQDVPVVIIDGELIVPESLSAYGTCSLHGITADASRVCGLISADPAVDGSVMYRPIYADMVDGEIGKPQLLPYPDKDFFGREPQYCSAVWISDDGKTILGQMADYSGQFFSPVVYKETADGEWTYSLPTKPLFNPDNIELPEDPGDFTLSPPEYTDYMDEEARQDYLDAMAEYVASGYQAELYPDPADYMSEEEAEKYNKASEEYNEKAMAYNEALANFYEAFNAILESSVSVLQNGQSMNADGTRMATAAILFKDGGYAPEEYYNTYIFNLEDGSYEVAKAEFDSSYSKAVPLQILPDGTVFATTPVNYFGGNPPQTFVIRKGTAEYIPLEDFVEGLSPVNAEWMRENLLHEREIGFDPDTYDPIYGDFMYSGNAKASNDLSVIAGAVMAFYFSEDYYYMTYVMTNDMTNVSSVAADNGAVTPLRDGQLLVKGNVKSIEVYDLAGRKVFETSGAEGLVATGLGGGLYVVSYTDEAGEKVSSKIRF